MAFRHDSASGPTVPWRLGRGVLVTVLATIVTGLLLGWLASLHGSIHSIRPVASSIALRTAGAGGLVGIGYVGLGLVRIYLTAIPALLFVLGAIAAAFDRRWGVAVAVVFGVAAASTLTVLTGCHCGPGSTAFLAQRAMEGIITGNAPFLLV